MGRRVGHHRRVAQAPARTRERPAGRKAAEVACERTSLHLPLPGGGRLRLPSPEGLVFAGSLALLGALEIIDWPVVVAVAVGHALSRNRQSAVLREFGEALEDS